MNSDADKFWEDMAPKLRRKKGFCPLSPEEAEKAFDAAPEVPLSDNEIQSIADAVVSGELVSWEPIPQDEFTDDLDFAPMDEQVMYLNRNRGEDDSDTDDIEAELRRELLSDDEKEDETGMAGGAAPA